MFIYYYINLFEIFPLLEMILFFHILNSFLLILILKNVHDLKFKFFKSKKLLNSWIHIYQNTIKKLLHFLYLELNLKCPENFLL